VHRGVLGDRRSEAAALIAAKSITTPSGASLSAALIARALDAARQTIRI